jgi:hypothetical protein
MNFKHSGALGDVIYSLPILKQKWKETGEQQTLLIVLDVPILFYPAKNNFLKKVLFRIPERINFEFSKRNKKEPFDLTSLYDAFYPRVFHPAKNVLLNECGYRFIENLLIDQEYIENVDIYRDQKIDIDLDLFRNLPVDYTNGSIVDWHIQATGMHADTENPWILFKKDLKYIDTIVWGRSARYRNDRIDFSILEKYADHLVFIGLDSEYEDMKKLVPSLVYKKIETARQLASIIGSAKLYIGNGSFTFSVAEGIKVPRLYEQCLWCDSVQPKNNGHKFTNQAEFETLLEKYV